MAVREHVGEASWVDPVRRGAEAIDGPVVITDVRFPNEADLIEGMGGQLLRVVRPGQVADDTHVSEVILDTRPVHSHVFNYADVDDLHRKADWLAELWTTYFSA